MPDMPDDADDLGPCRSRTWESESLTDCALIRPYETSEPLVDDADLGAICRVRFLKEPALDQWYSECPEVIRRGCSPIETAGVRYSCQIRCKSGPLEFNHSCV